MKSRIIAVIPARKGSRRLKNKNRLRYKGVPLAIRAIRQCKRFDLIDKIIFTSDDDYLLKLAKKEGVTVIKRPKRLCRDDTPMIKVLKHALKNKRFECWVLLQPTSPLRSDGDVMPCLFQAYYFGFESSHTVVKVKDVDDKVTYQENGAVYCGTKRLLSKNKLHSVKPYLKFMNKRRSLDINTKKDLVKLKGSKK
jgi:CMP-N-acetylneuraminic acid synthetase